MNDPNHRARIAKRIHDLLLHELGEDIDIGLMLGHPEYARPVLSLCRGSGRPELVALSEEFSRVGASSVASSHRPAQASAAH